MESADASWAPESPNLSSHHEHDNEPIHPQHQGYRGSISHSLPYSPPASSPTLPAGMPRGLPKEESIHDADYVPDAPQPMTDKMRGKRKEGPAPPAAQDNVNITVHFPVARIKRIMQADDDVGKVAQVTPVVVCKPSCTHPLPLAIANPPAQPRLSNSS